MIRLVALLSLLLAPALASAETVRVLSGEHADFTRLLVEVPDGLVWHFGRVDGGFEFRPDRGDIDYDLSRAFDLIPRTRILALEDRGNGRLFVAVDCACHGDAFDLRQGQVVLDVKDGLPPVAGSPFEARLPGIDMPVAGPAIQPVGAVASKSEGASGDDLANARAGLPLWPGDEQAAKPAAGQYPALAEGAPASETAESPMLQGHPPGHQVSEIQSALLEQVARAAAQGLLDADLGAVEAGVARAANPLGLPEPRVEEPLPPPPLPPVAPRGHISVETSVDHALGGGVTDPATPAPPPACLAPEYFDIANWGAPVELGADIGEYRSHLVGEFDIANGEGITDLARYYLYITFGAEAKALVRRYPADVVRGDLLMAIGDIMDSGFAESAMSLVDQMTCDSTVALWAALAQPELYRAQEVNTDAVALAFSALPSHLRDHLGPGLADKFLAIGETATADMIRNAIRRDLGETEGAIEVLDARFDLAEGRVDEATARLDHVIATGDEVLPEALLERVGATLTNNGAVPEELASLLASLAFERRGSEIGARLKQAEIRARASLADFEAAFATLDAASADGTISADDQAELANELLGQLAAKASDASFMTLCVGRLGTAVHLPADTRRQLAQRFLDLGFSGPARTILGGEGAMPNEADRLIYARAAMVEGRPEVAISYLAGLEGESASRLRAEALVLARDYTGAVRAYGEIGDTAARRNAAWQGGLWSEVARLDTGVEGRAAGLMTGLPGQTGLTARAEGASDPTMRVPDTPLARGQSLVESSRASRATLDALLQEIPPPTVNAAP